jgi:hypothetical protein
MYAEITKEAFDNIVLDEPSKDVENLELCRKTYYLVYGISIVAIENYVTTVEQYYIRDINS